MLAMIAGVFLGWSSMGVLEPHLIHFGGTGASSNSRATRTAPVRVFEHGAMSCTTFYLQSYV